MGDEQIPRPKDNPKVEASLPKKNTAPPRLQSQPFYSLSKSDVSHLSDDPFEASPYLPRSRQKVKAEGKALQQSPGLDAPELSDGASNIGSFRQRSPERDVGVYGESNSEEQLLAQRSLGQYPDLDGYWIPSTGTIDRRGDRRRGAFSTILQNPKLDTYYVDVLAPAGPTVDAYPGNILPVGGDALEEFDEQAAEEHRGGEIVPWLEGTGYWRGDSQFYAQFKGTDAILGYDGQAYYADILDPDVWGELEKFVRDFCTRYASQRSNRRSQRLFNTVMIDDHFGIHRSTEPIMIAKYAPILGMGNNVNQLSQAQIRRIREYIRDGVTQRVGELSSILAGYGISLSASVNLFDFALDDMNLSQAQRGQPGNWDNAMRTNYQDIAEWIERGYIGGEINIQLYRDVRDFINEYDKFIEILRQHLDDREDDASYIASFPEISVSISQEGRTGSQPWSLTHADVGAIISHVRRNSQIGPYGGRTFEVTIAGFDATDFEYLQP